MTTAPTEVDLAPGVRIPAVGFGTYLIDGADAEHAVTTALQAGYRHVDGRRVAVSRADATMESSMRDRVLLGGVGLLALFGPLLNLVLAPGFEDGAFDTTLGRIVNSASYFTNTTNVLVGVTFLLLLRDRDRGPGFRALHLSGVLAAVIVGSVYHLLLSDLNDPTGLYVLTDLTSHTLVPILAPLTWLVVGPRGRTDLWTVLGTVAYPLAWLTYAMVRGALVTGNDGTPYYPYPFLDAADLGYGTALVNVAGIAAVFLVLAAAAAVVDRALTRRRVPA